MKKSTLLLALGGAAALTAAAAGQWSYRQMLARIPAGDEKTAWQSRQWMEAQYEKSGLSPMPYTWKAEHPPICRSLRSMDGLFLVADEYPSEKAGHRWVVTVHGYRSAADGMLAHIQLFHKMGFHVLAPELRGHGRSAGDYEGMGGPDRLDLLQWIDWIINRDPAAEIVLHGVSMGASVVVMTTGETLPPQVRCAVEDCGYSSAGDAIKYLMVKREFPAPGLLLRCLELVGRRKARFSLLSVQPEEQIRRCKIPMLFIHGEDDSVVPFYMSGKLYAAHPGEKEYWSVPGSGHIAAYFTDPQGYESRVKNFISRYLTAEEE